MRSLDRMLSSGAVVMLTFALASGVACSPTRRPSLPPPDPGSILLYEGLPHQGYEPERLAEESKKATITRGGSLFYQDPLPLKQADAKAIASILADPDSFVAFGGEKKCGGFHPDYAILVGSSGGETSYLICFGCGEAEIIRPGQPKIRYDLGYDAKHPRLKSILTPYQKNRPRPVSGP